MSAEIFAAAADVVFTVLGDDSWWLRRSGGAPTAVRAVFTSPEADDLERKAPMSLPQQLVSVQIAASAGDLIARDGRTWLLGGVADSDPLGLSQRWIATELQVAVAYHADGYPLVTWSGTAWVPPP